MPTGPSQKETAPVGMPGVPPLALLTTAVRLIAWPKTSPVVGAAVIAVLVLANTTL